MTGLTRRTLLGGGLAAAAATTATALTAQPSFAATHPAKYSEYYRYFDVGPRGFPMHDTHWAAQGLTNWGRDLLIISYYDSRYEGDDWKKRANSRIVILHRATLRPIKTLILDTQRHVGGIATTGHFFWVAMDGRLLRYPVSRLSKPSGSLIRADHTADIASDASYAFGQGENVWVGTCDHYHRSSMYRYAVASSGALTRREVLPTPPKVQGVAVVGNRIVWSTSWGTADSRLVVWPRHTRYNGDARIGNWITCPPRSEGLAYAAGRLHLIYESSALRYRSTTPHVIRSVHHGSMPSLNG
ncbi:hypothetical protein GCM10011492_38370 [Flexivirga endophytica]|uniref:Twin-arginine translocation signal domain-containing protein n=1 Tax=Flexivirga endophytica TaxID=1849103 RepID=A0A916TG66_9MICO|nr:hypothetical protein [Flexivirga endophytica]GGB43677.1 hypothetical protein GCM10011492_38370 [Flexivirga endophytica]GHB68177.1 hypothetical protein GCM10008112_41130 [Flexivirga endophytica]